MDELPEVDDEIVQLTKGVSERKRADRERRICEGVLSEELVAAAPAYGNPVEPAALEMSLAEREERWGFTFEELQTATKVVRRLHATPSLFQNDPLLAETRLYTMISRDRVAKRENRDVLRRVMKEEKTRHQQEVRRYDESTIAKTKMRQERDESLRRLLQPAEEHPAITDRAAPLAIPDRAAPSQGDSQAASPTTPYSPSGESDDPSAPLATKRLCTCHICKAKYTQLHHYYYALCCPCGDFNHQKRLQTRDLSGKIVLLTGCRIKIGYEMALSLLRCGAVVIGTTRFAHDALGRFCQEKDFAQWEHRLHLFALDLRDLWMVDQFCAFLLHRFFTQKPNEDRPRKLFAIINNAAQTIARSPEYSRDLRSREVNPPAALRSGLASRPEDWEWMMFVLKNSALTIGLSVSLEPRSSGTPAGLLGDGVSSTAVGCEDDLTDAERSTLTAGQPSTIPVFDRYDTAAEVSDRRLKNSWTLQLHEVPPVEASEVMAINALAPFVFNAKLKPAMVDEDAKASEPRFVINVSAMEGQFYRYKQTTHPHTNMAKAALNMMTRTSAEDYAKCNIYMNAVDTGWITDESPIAQRQRRVQQSEAQLCPLDEVDAAARCLDLIYINSTEYGQFWKNYTPIPW